MDKQELVDMFINDKCLLGEQYQCGVDILRRAFATYVQKLNINNITYPHIKPQEFTLIIVNMTGPIHKTKRYNVHRGIDLKNDEPEHDKSSRKKKADDKCTWILLSGPRVGQQCGKSYCYSHPKSVDLQQGPVPVTKLPPTPSACRHIMLSGPRKGKPCGRINCNNHKRSLTDNENDDDDPLEEGETWLRDPKTGKIVGKMSSSPDPDASPVQTNESNEHKYERLDKQIRICSGDLTLLNVTMSTREPLDLKSIYCQNIIMSGPRAGQVCNEPYCKLNHEPNLQTEPNMQSQQLAYNHNTGETYKLIPLRGPSPPKRKVRIIKRVPQKTQHNVKQEETDEIMNNLDNYSKYISSM